MRARSVIIVAILVGTTTTMILCLYLILPLFVPILAPAEVLRDKANQEKEKAGRQEQERREAYAKQQERLRKLFENKRDSIEICQIHNDNLKADRVRIAYGLIIPPQEYREAQEGQFPNSNNLAYGGCIVQEPEFACVLFCTRCREQESRWEAQHHKGPKTEKPNKENFTPIGSDEAAAHLVKKVEATYPGLAEQARIAGVVKLNLYINQT